MLLDRKYCFPNEEKTDEQLVKELGLIQPLDTIEFKNPQLLALQFFRQAPRGILSFDKGMGKTAVYLQAAQEIGSSEHNLILCTKGAMLRQRQEMQLRFPGLEEDVVFIRGGTPAERKSAWEKKARYHVSTFASYLTDSGRRMTSRKSGERSKSQLPSWCYTPKVLIGDEYHRVLRNRGSATHNLFRQLVRPEHLILSSGSVANKGPHSMWTALNICEPTLFTSYWKYVNTFCVVEDTPYGKQIIGVRNRDAWRRTIAPYCFHRRKDLKDYPSKTRSALPVEMDNVQKRVHDELRKKLLTILPNDALLTAPNTLAATTKIRQLLICPKFIDPSLGWGAGLEGILEDVQDSELTHFVVSTYFTGPIPLIEEFFRLHKIPAYHLQGGMDMDQMEQSIKNWTDSGGAMVQSIEFAESYELPAASNMYMLGYHHDPERNSQAEDRIHRDLRVTPHPVNIYYVKHLGAYDERIIEAMSMHADNIHYLMHSPAKDLFA